MNDFSCKVNMNSLSEQYWDKSRQNQCMRSPPPPPTHTHTHTHTIERAPLLLFSLIHFRSRVLGNVLFELRSEKVNLLNSALTAQPCRTVSSAWCNFGPGARYSNRENSHLDWRETDAGLHKNQYLRTNGTSAPLAWRLFWTTIVAKNVGTIGPSPLLPSSMLRYRAIGPVRRPNFVRGEGAALYRPPIWIVVSENYRLNL